MSVVRRIKEWLFYKKQKCNLLYPNEDYINSLNNINKADQKRMEKVFELFKDLRGSMIDIGCNDGYLMRHFDWQFDSFVGIDMFSIDQYTKGKFSQNEALYTKNGKIKYYTSLFESVDNLREFDFIFAGEIIEHVPDTAKFLNKMKQCIKEGGVFCITTPNDIGGNLKEHYRQYNKHQFKKELSLYFSSVNIIELPQINDSWPFLLAYGKK